MEVELSHIPEQPGLPEHWAVNYRVGSMLFLREVLFRKKEDAESFIKTLTEEYDNE
jgi:hypothetical protein